MNETHRNRISNPIEINFLNGDMDSKQTWKGVVKDINTMDYIKAGKDGKL